MLKPQYLDLIHYHYKGDDNITTTTCPNGELSHQRIAAENEIQQCPICNSTELVLDDQRAELYWIICGSVLDENFIDQGPEWRAFDNDQRIKRTRVGAPKDDTKHDGGLPTVIYKRNKDYNGRPIPTRNQAQIDRIRKWNTRIRISGAGERNLAFALGEIDRRSSNLNLPKNVRIEASVIYKKAAKKNIVRGRSIEGVVASSIYAACRCCNVPRTLEEISEVSKVSKKEVARNYRFLSRELNLNLKPTSPADYIPRFVSKIGLSNEAESKAILIIDEASKKGLTSGKGPTGVAAAALYIASVLLGERKTQKEVANASGVTEVTIRNRYKELSKHLDVFTV